MTATARIRGAGFALCVAMLTAPSNAAAAPRVTHRATASVRVTYSDPAGSLPTGSLGADPFRAVLPSGRIVTPEGASVVVGMSAMRTAITPDGRFAIATCDGERGANSPSAVDPRITGSYALTVVDLSSMQVVEQYRAAGERFSDGIIAVADPAHRGGTLVLASGGPDGVVYALTLDSSGRLTADAHPSIAIPKPQTPTFPSHPAPFPNDLLAAPNGRLAYVLDEAGNAISSIDLASGTAAGGAIPTGFLPGGAAVAHSTLLVANEGLMRYAPVDPPLVAPPFSLPPANLAQASSLSLVPLSADGDPTDPPAGTVASEIPMDPAPNGFDRFGGAHPEAIATTPDGAYAFVAMAGVDRIATVSLDGTPRVVGGTELRLFDRAPYGTNPSDLALSRDGTRLYVTLAGLDAVAVIDAHDPLHLHRVGLIPTGWFPTALALSDNDRTLIVTNAKGFGHDRALVEEPLTEGDATTVWSTVEKIDLRSVDLGRSTSQTLADTRRTVAVRTNPIVPQTLVAGPSRRIKHVIVIVEEDKSFDSVLGDLAGPAAASGDSTFAAFGAAVTPNLHALARSYGLAANLYSDGVDDAAGHRFLSEGTSSLFADRSAMQGGWPGSRAGENPEDATRSGSIFDALARGHLAGRDYGELLRVSGYDDSAIPDAQTDSASAGPGDTAAPAQTLGALYRLDTPADVKLAGHVDLAYPAWNPLVRDERRAAEFIHDYGALARGKRAPAYAEVVLPDDRASTGRGVPPVAEEVADGDRALGEVVAAITRFSSWPSTAVFVLPASSANARDHVDAFRGYAVVISPYARRRYIGRRHLSTVSVVKTAEELLGLPPLALDDLLASDMADFFTTRPLPGRYTAIPVPTQPAAP